MRLNPIELNYAASIGSRPPTLEVANEDERRQSEGGGGGGGGGKEGKLRASTCTSVCL